jgi:hypothetical protein
MIRRYLSLVVTALLAAVAGLAFHRVFGPGPVLPVAAVAAAVPTLLSGLLSGPRKAGRPWPLWIALVLTVAAWAGTAAVTVLRPALSEGTLPQAVREGVLGSWKSILTTLLPAPAEPEFLLLVHVLVWLAAFGSAELALRTSLRAAPCLPALAVFGAALLLGVDGPGSNLGPAAASVVLIAVLVLVRADGGEAGEGGGAGAVWRPLPAGVPMAAALGAVAFLAAPYVPVSADPYNPREQVQAPPPQQRDGVSPLDRVGGWLLAPDQVLFSVEASRSGECAACGAGPLRRGDLVVHRPVRPDREPGAGRAGRRRGRGGGGGPHLAAADHHPGPARRVGARRRPAPPRRRARRRRRPGQRGAGRRAAAAVRAVLPRRLRGPRVGRWRPGRGRDRAGRGGARGAAPSLGARRDETARAA